MDVRRLRVLHEVAVQRSFSAAALELGYTQSAVSHHVAALEREVGLTLVDRAARPVRLTPAGEALDRHARAIVGQVAAAEAELRALAGLEAGSLRLGAFMSACMSLIPSAIATLHRRHPGLDAQASVLEPPAARDALLAGRIDLAVTFEMPQHPDPQDERLVRRPLFDDPYVIILPARDPRARRPGLRLADLRDADWHMPPSGRYRETAIDLCRQAGFEPRVPYATGDVYIAQGFVSAGIGVALVPRLALLSPRAGMAVVEVEGAPTARRLMTERRAGHRLPSADVMEDILAGLPRR